MLSEGVHIFDCDIAFISGNGAWTYEIPRALKMWLCWICGFKEAGRLLNCYWLSLDMSCASY